jgi:hypothetical protein
MLGTLLATAPHAVIDFVENLKFGPRGRGAPEEEHIMKMMKRLIVTGILLVILIVGGAFFYIDQIAKKGIEEGATFALGTDTTLNSANIKVVTGNFKMADMNVQNPKGFSGDQFLKLGSGEVAVSLRSLIEDTVRVPLISLDGLDLLLEGKVGKTNADVVLENVGKLSSGENAPKEEKAANESGGKKFMIDEITITNVSMRVVMPPFSSPDKPIVVKVPEILLKDVGSDSDKGVLLSELTGIILSATIRTMVENGADVLPQAILGSLDAALASAGDLGKIGGEIVGKITLSSGEMVESAAKVVDEAGKQVAAEADKAATAAKEAADSAGKEVGKLVDGVGGLLGGEKKKEE